VGLYPINRRESGASQRWRSRTASTGELLGLFLLADVLIVFGLAVAHAAGLLPAR
jgi:hypothetical protein